MWSGFSTQLKKPCGSCCTAAAGTITRDGSSCGRNRIVTLPPGSGVLRIGKLGPHRYAAGAGVDPVIDRGQHPVAPFTINLNLRQPRLLQSVDIGVLAGFAEKRGFVEGERDPHRIQLHNVHQHAAGRIDQRPDVKGAMARDRSPAPQSECS